MEYANGGQLFNKMSQYSYSESDAAKFVQQILIGLKVLHYNNIIHRDLKPENLLLSKDYNTGETTIKISDFGLAGILSSEKIFSEFCGTTHYTAPEIIDNKPYDSSVDIWSLGVIVYAILSGSYPFSGESDQDLKLNILMTEPKFDSYQWNEISEDAVDFIKKILKFDPKDRITIDEALNHPWLTGNAPKIELDDLRKHLTKFNLNEKIKNIGNRAKAAIKLRNLISKE